MARSLMLDIPGADTTMALQVRATRGMSAAATINLVGNIGYYKNIVTYAPGSWSSPVDLLAAWDSRYSTPFAAGEAVWVSVRYISPDGLGGPELNFQTIAS